MTFPSLSGIPLDLPNHVEKEFRKNSIHSLRYGYQHLPDHEGVEGKFVLEAGDLVD